MKTFDPEGGIDISDRPIWQFLRRLIYFCVIVVCLFFLGKWGITTFLKKAARDSLASKLQWMKERKDHQLEFYSTDYTDETLQHLRGNVDVEYLEFNQTDITATGVAELNSLPNLKGLVLYGGRAITNQCMVLLKDFPKLERLTLRNTQVNDEGIIPLIELPQLKHLSLEDDKYGGTTFTEKALTNLSQFTQLKSLYLSGRWATDDEVENLRKKLPTCKISLR